MLLELPAEILRHILDIFLHETSIKDVVVLRLTSRLIDTHVLDVIYSLPTFDGVISPPHVSWHANMHTDFFAGLIRAKLNKGRETRPLIQEIKESIGTMQMLVGADNTSEYLETFIKLAAKSLPKAEIITRLRATSGTAVVASRAVLLKNGLVAAIFQQRQPHVTALLEAGAKALGHTTFGEPLWTAACYANPEIFYNLVRLVSMQSAQVHRSTSYLVVALERAASLGRVEIFNKGLQKSLLQYSDIRRSCYRTALKAALTCGQDKDGMALLKLLEVEGNDRLHFDDGSPWEERWKRHVRYWREVLRLACSEDCQGVVKWVLTNIDKIENPSLRGRIDRILEEATRMDHVEVVKMILDHHQNGITLERSGALFWASRNARYDVLRLLLHSKSDNELSNISDALAGASTCGQGAVADVLEIFTEAWQRDVTRYGGQSFTQIMDGIQESDTGITSGLMLIKPWRMSQVDWAEHDILPEDDDYEEQPHNDLRRACSEGDFRSMKRILREHESSPRDCLLDFAQSFRANKVPTRPGVLRYICESWAVHLSPGDQIFKEIALSGIPPISVLQVLLEHGWDMSSTYDVYIPSMLVRSIGDTTRVKWLLAHGADANAMNHDWNNTPLSTAFNSEALLSTVFVLLSHGGDLRHGQILHHVIKRRKLARGTASDQLALIDWLLAMGAPLNSRFYENDSDEIKERVHDALSTPFKHAVLYDNPDVVELLLGRGADWSIPDKRGDTLLDMAVRRKQGKIEEMLRSAVLRGSEGSNSKG